MTEPRPSSDVVAAPAPGRAPVTHETIAAALRSSPDAPLLVPTDEQRRVIEAPHAPSLVVAGAGSGKTQTMVQRMLWLVAAHGVAPANLLGLTFTRKAAGELRERIDQGLRRLRRAGLVPGDENDLPEVSTYNSFAHRVFQEHALLIGREPEAALLDESSAYQLMRRVVLRSDDPELAALDKDVAGVTRGALDLARAMRENDVHLDDIEAFTERMGRLRLLPGRKQRGQLIDLAQFVKLLDRLRPLPAFARLAVAYEHEKRTRGLIEFTDQVAGALEICERAPEVPAALRARHTHVILDEYQDTSVGQTRLLSALFRDHSLMAVGDPKQSIYGWRGASAANMNRFHADFGARPDATFTLSTSWRNDRTILAAANTVAEPLADDGPIRLPELEPRSGAGTGAVESIVSETVAEEYAAIADWFARAFAVPPAARPSAAVLFRTRASMAHVARELTARGVPARIIGVGGLMSTPEIADLVSVLRAARDPDAGSELMRLLVGARAMLGVADVAALHDLARRLAPREYAEHDEPQHERGERLEIGPDGEAALADAVSFVGSAPDDHAWLASLSPDARPRIRRIAHLLDDVRGHLGLPLVDLVEYVIARTGLDLEAGANPHRPQAMGNLDAFVDQVVAYLTANPGTDVGGLLDWLEVAADRDDIAAAEIEPEPGAVQLLTIHGAKGLEWDLVAIPALIEGGLPQSSREGSGWFSAGTLPYPLRLDAADLPSVPLEGFDTQREAKTALDDDLKRLVRERFLLEERRLAYVGITRARHRLLLTASYWGETQQKIRALSPYFLELVDAALLPQPPACRNPEQKPESTGARGGLTWPRPAFRGDEAAALRGAADDLRRAIDDRRAGGAPGAPSGWDHSIDLLLRERDERRRTRPVTLPERLAASHFKDLVLDPESAAAQWRRPMPQRPFRQTRLGTMFHAWVESRFDAPAGGGDLLDGDTLDLHPDELELLGLAAPTTSDAQRLADLQQRFERSAWADRRPLAVEQTIEVPLGGRTVVCKLDAVYEGDDGTIEVVDWKTGAAPRGAAAEWERQLQLALYTLAYSRHRGLPPERIRAVLFYVAEGEAGVEYRFDRVSDEAELERLLAEAEARIAALAD